MMVLSDVYEGYIENPVFPPKDKHRTCKPVDSFPKGISSSRGPGGHMPGSMLVFVGLLFI